MQISALVSDISQFKKWVKYANEMTVDVIHSTQYYAEHHKYGYPSQFALQTIETWQANSSAENTPMAIKKFHSHGNSLFSSPHPIDFNVLVIFSLKYVKQGHKLELTYIYACGIMHMKCCKQISKWNAKGGQ